MTFEKFPPTLKQAVQWGEMDALGHVNNVAYIRYFESSRVDVFHQLNIWQLLREKGLMIVLVKLECIYKVPLVYPDNIEIGSRIKSIGKTSMIVEHIVKSEKHGVAAYGDGVIVCVDIETGKSQPVPQEFIDLVAHMLD